MIRARPIKLLFIAPEPASPTTSGHVLMHRHLSRLSTDFAVIRAHCVSDSNDHSHLITTSPLYRRLRRTRWGRVIEGLDAITGLSASASIGRILRMVKPDVVLVVAEPPVFIATVRRAVQRRIPVVSVVHDWSTLWLDIPRKLRCRADGSFLHACRQSTCTLSVSPELAAAIGENERHRVVYPVPAGKAVASPPTTPTPFRTVYAGSFHYFQPKEIGALCAALTRAGESSAFRIWGPRPDRNFETLAPVLNDGYYNGLAAQTEVEAILSAAGALLVVCPFDSRWRQFAQYSFPSKIADYCRIGRPIILWAPEYAAATAWARRTDSAWVVTDPDPRTVISAMLSLARDSTLAMTLGAAALREARETFDPQKLQAAFESGLLAALDAKSDKVH